jgi:predicted acylesterase/phospholipase RssA
LFVLVGCASIEVDSLTPPLGLEPPSILPTTIRTLGADQQFSQLSSTTVAELWQARHPGEPLNILALSGGGAAGAFGAGAVAGLTRSGSRPNFAVVTGVSAGALIAPYAFLGPAWDVHLIDAFTGEAATHLLQSRGLGVVFSSSLYSGRPLKELVDSYASDAMIAAVAREADRGRLLLVATTNVVTGQPVVWDLGSIALNGGASARTLFRDVLIASASIPGMFPPVIVRIREDGAVHDEAHVDGGATVPFFVPPEFLQGPAEAMDEEHRTMVYVIVDGQLGETAHATRMTARAILTRGIHAGLDHMLLTTLELTAATAQLRGADLRYSAIPRAYPHVDPLDVRTATRQSLFRYAFECAQARRLWNAFGSTNGERGIVDNVARDLTVPCPADEPLIRFFASR